jgi:hypothetical protein
MIKLRLFCKTREFDKDLKRPDPFKIIEKQFLQITPF